MKPAAKQALRKSLAHVGINVLLCTALLMWAIFDAANVAKWVGFVACLVSFVNGVHAASHFAVWQIREIIV